MQIESKIDELKLLDQVLIEWVDAHSLPLEGWVTHDFIESLDVDCRVRSIGYFICRKNDFIVIAMDIIDQSSNGFNNEYNSSSGIPVACIKSIEVIGRG